MQLCDGDLRPTSSRAVALIWWAPPFADRPPQLICPQRGKGASRLNYTPTEQVCLFKAVVLLRDHHTQEKMRSFGIKPHTDLRHLGGRLEFLDHFSPIGGSCLNGISNDCLSAPVRAVQMTEVTARSGQAGWPSRMSAILTVLLKGGVPDCPTLQPFPRRRNHVRFREIGVWTRKTEIGSAKRPGSSRSAKELSAVASLALYVISRSTMSPTC